MSPCGVVEPTLNQRNLLRRAARPLGGIRPRETLMAQVVPLPCIWNVISAGGVPLDS